MKRILLPIALLLLIGAGCDNGQQKLIQDQQAQIDALKTTLKEQSEAQVQMNTQNTQNQIAPKPTVKTSPSPSNNTENAQIKIETCKAQVKIITDNETYVQDTEIDDVLSKANCGADKTCVNAVFKYLDNLSDTRKTTDYNHLYINCLSK